MGRGKLGSFSVDMTDNSDATPQKIVSESSSAFRMSDTAEQGRNAQ